MAVEMTDEIEQLKAERNAIILAHNYQLPEVQELADVVGDSLGLSRTAASADADVVVFCGVHFMAETASMLCPDRTVLIPTEAAGCAMVDMAPVERLRELKDEHPDAAVVTYVNSSAAMKAESDYCCTSANAVQVVESVPEDREVIFLPDRNLGSYVQEQTGRELILFDAHCPTHVRIMAEDINRLRRARPDAEVMVHPECRPEVRRLADHVESTGGMCRRAEESDAQEMVVGTELGMSYRLRRDNPDKTFYIVSEAAICPDMKKIDRSSIARCLREMEYRVEVPDQIRGRAERAVSRMVEVTGEE
ncbi:MAG: quinolinate synthase NadA [Planctomycetota bacterium]